MPTIKRDAKIEISASADDLWKILADEFTEVSKWVDAVITSGPNPAAPDGVNGSRYGGRVCDVQGLGKTEEVLTAYDADSHTFSYSVAAANFPDFLTKLENTWSVEPVSQDRAKVKAQFPKCMHGLLIAAARQARGDALPTMPMRWNHRR